MHVRVCVPMWVYVHVAVSAFLFPTALFAESGSPIGSTDLFCLDWLASGPRWYARLYMTVLRLHVHTCNHAQILHVCWEI